jgi:nucleotide-binding universal stress UspA family protein
MHSARVLCSGYQQRPTSLATFNTEGAIFRKILVAVDGSRHASAALALGVDLAPRYAASLCLLHAFPHISDLLGTPYHEDLLAARTTIGQQLLEAARMQAGEALPVETQLVEGPPAPAILRAAKEGDYDLIVLGSRGHEQITSLLLGSVSSAVAQHAHCRVLIVH